MKLGDHAGVIEGEAFDEEGRIIAPNKSFISFRFTSYDNPYLSKEWIDSRKERLTEAAFNQEYLARFEKFTGLIYKEFDRNLHIIVPFEIPDHWPRYRAMDYGAVNATVCLWIAVAPNDQVYVYDEYYNSAETSKFHANVIMARTGNISIIATYGDPSAQQEVLDYSAEGVIVTPATKIVTGDSKDWVNSGIEKVRQLLKPRQGKPLLYVFRNCVNTIREFESYHWIETKTSEIIKDIPEKVDDHCLDALRYFVVSWVQEHPTENIMQEYLWESPARKVNPFTGY
mgnify:FL=1